MLGVIVTEVAFVVDQVNRIIWPGAAVVGVAENEIVGGVLVDPPPPPPEFEPPPPEFEPPPPESDVPPPDWLPLPLPVLVPTAGFELPPQARRNERTKRQRTDRQTRAQDMVKLESG